MECINLLILTYDFGTHLNVRHSVYSILRMLRGTARLMKLRLGMWLTEVAGQRCRLVLVATRAPREPGTLRAGHGEGAR